MRFFKRMIKNKYIYPEEIKSLINKINENNNRLDYLKQIILLMYNNGYTGKEASKTINKSLRACEIAFKKLTKNTITLGELRYSWKMSNPQKLYKKLQKRYGSNRNKIHHIKPRLRWTILSRDKFKCVACGIDSRKTILHIDHIKPISLGGETKEDNLRTLCGQCNFGRGNIILNEAEDGGVR